MTAIAGTTRDVITHSVTWGAYHFELTDTGGLFGASEDPLHELVKAQGSRALTSADVIVMVVDGREGLIAGDQDIAQAARDTGVPVILAINKTDDRRAREGALELSRLGFNPVVEISAEHGEGVGDLLDEIAKHLEPSRTTPVEPPEPLEPLQPQETAIAIVGRPNAGKSSLVNRLLREDRMIVSEVPGTTRDSVDALLQWHKRTFRIVDTAGIRRPGKVSKSQVESVSVLLAKKAIERADVVVLVLDATIGPADQDGAIAGAAKEAGKGIIIVANKWDLMKGPRGQQANGPTEDMAKAFDEKVRYQLKFLDYAPILHVSAMTGERTPKLLEMVDRVATASKTRVSTGELNRFIEKLTTASPPVTSSKRNVRIKYASQVSVSPPTFVLFANAETKFHFSYERFLENRLRESYDFFGNPIRIQVRGRRDDRREPSDSPAKSRARRSEKRKPVKKGPGSKPTHADRARTARGHRPPKRRRR